MTKRAAEIIAGAASWHGVTPGEIMGPRGRDPRLRDARRAAVLALRQAGCSWAEIARGMNFRPVATVRNWIRAGRKDER